MGEGVKIKVNANVFVSPVGIKSRKMGLAHFFHKRILGKINYLEYQLSDRNCMQNSMEENRTYSFPGDSMQMTALTIGSVLSDSASDHENQRKNS